MKVLNITLLGDKPEEGFVATIDAQGFKCVGVPRDKIALACNCDEVDSNGIYFLVNRNESVLSKRFIYVGKTKQGPKRLIDHKQKKNEWEFAYMFLGPKSSLNMQIVDELEAYEIPRYKNCEAFKCEQDGKNLATPTPIAIAIAKEIEVVMTFFGYGIEQSLKIQNAANAKELAAQIKEPGDNEERIYLDSGIVISGHQPYKYVFMGETYSEEKMSFRSVMKSLTKALFDEHKEEFIALANKTGKDGINEIRNENKGTDVMELGDGVFLETHRSALDIFKYFIKLLTYLRIDIHELYFYIS